MITAQSQTLKPNYHHGDLREVLLRSGEAALIELGVGGVTLREIARRAGVSHAAPKHHFAGLGDLLGDLAARGFERFTIALATAADTAKPQTAAERLQAMGMAYGRFARENPALYGLMFGQNEYCAMTENLGVNLRAAWLQLETAAAAVVGKDRAAQAAVLVWSTVHGLAMLTLAKRLPPQVKPGNDEREMLRRVLSGLKLQKK